MLRSKGFTLIEVLVAIFGFTLIASGLIVLMSQIFISANMQAGLLSDSDQARKVAFNFIKEIRNAVVGSDGAYPLSTAGDQQVVFYSDTNSSIQGVEKIRYYVSGGKLYKGVTSYSNSGYNPQLEQTFVVQNNLANGSGAVFSYYDDTYIGSSTQSSLIQPVNVTQVNYIKISLKVYNKGGVVNTNYYTITAGGTIRNLKTNLGN